MLKTVSKTRLFVLIGFGLYFGVILIPRVVPDFGASSFIFLSNISLMFTMPLLVLLAIWSATAFVFSRLRKRPIGPRSKTAGQIAAAGFIAFFFFVVLANLLPSPLPTGSYAKQFNREVWLDSESAEFRIGDITLRQKMLADVVNKLPGKNRTAIENMLGPSENTPYFSSTGRDLIYKTGPQRDTLFSLDSEWLLIWVDANGTYSNHAIGTD